MPLKTSLTSSQVSSHTRRMTTFGLGLPQIAPLPDELPELASMARRAEALGFETLWVSELASAPVLDPLAVLAHAAAVTSRVRLGVGVILAPLRAPIHLAQSLASVDVLSDGRLIAGVGLGSKPDIYPRYGLTADRRLRRYLDGLDLLQRLWTEDGVRFASSWWTLTGDANVIRPAQRPQPPLWFGARQEPALRRAVKRGDGWLASGSILGDEFMRSFETVRAQLTADGRDRSTFTIAKRVYIAVAPDTTTTRERLRRWFGAVYGAPQLGDQVVVVGSAEHCATQLRTLADLGVDHLLLNPVFDEVEQMEILADSVIPAV